MSNSRPVFLLVFASLALGIPAEQAEAQTCTFALCNADERYSPGGTDAWGPFGVCARCNWLGHCSHTLEHCPLGSTLDSAAGTCTWDVCGAGACGGSLPLCPADRVYTGSGVDGTGAYGVCSSGPNGFGGYRSHELLRCLPGWTLQPTTGLCRRDCLPNLIIRRTWLRNTAGITVTSLVPGQAYDLCVDVANVGSAAAGSFIVQGGGLGVPVPPSVTIPGLAAGASRTPCLRYARAPGAGTWRVGVAVDPGFAVRETSDIDNSTTVTVVVR
jgi:hypothetical protein